MNNNFRSVKKILWIILFANLFVAAIKIILGTIVKSTSMAADGYHSLTDGSSNIVGLIGIHLSSKPTDTDHPYGHRKFETLAGLFISGMLFLLGGRIIVESIGKFIHPATPEITTGSLIALIITLIINIVVCTLEYRKGKALGSQILISDSMHTRSDIYISLGVLITLGGIKLGLPPVIDPAASLVVSGFILYAAYEIFRSNSDILVDKAVVDTEEIRSIAAGFQQVKDIHDIRSRGDKNALYIEMHIMTDPNLSIQQSHELIHSIEDKIRLDINKNAQVTAHLEPYDKN